MTQNHLALRGQQERLPNRRRSETYKFKVGGSPSTFLHTGDFPDGRLGEIFLTQARIGSFSRGMLDAFALVCSKALQFGMPLDELCDSFINSRFEPSGVVEGDTELTEASSLLDYVFRRLKIDYAQHLK